MVARLVDEGIDHVDINFGCPVRKVTSHGGGSAIPLKPRLVARLVRAMVRSAGSVPVTIKMRKGIDDQLSTYLDAGKVAQEEGASAVGLHARTAAQLYAGEADWDAIADLKSHLAVPVLGNGDIWEPWDALRMMRTTGCDAVIVGRGCLGRPWLFRELAQVFAGIEPPPPPRLGEIAAIMLDHGERMVQFFGPRMGIVQMRKWTSWYTKGFRGSAALRAQMMQIETLEELRAIVAQLDASEEFPLHALRTHRGKGTRVQRVSLPEGYLDARDDDTPPRGPNSPEELAAWESALNAG
jgi:nifR3 family TIM-barrel protein